MHSPPSLSIRPRFKPRPDKKLKIKSVEFKDRIYHVEKPLTLLWMGLKAWCNHVRRWSPGWTGPSVSWSWEVYSDTRVVKDAAGLLQSALVAQSRTRKLRVECVCSTRHRPGQQWALGDPGKPEYFPGPHRKSSLSLLHLCPTSISLSLLFQHFLPDLAKRSSKIKNKFLDQMITSFSGRIRGTELNFVLTGNSRYLWNNGDGHWVLKIQWAFHVG